MGKKSPWGAARMVRLGISVEGTTEVRFIEMLITPYLLNKGIYIQPISIEGIVGLDRIRSELKKMAASFDYITTFYDFYGFKGVDTNTETKESLEQKILNSVHTSIQPRLIPYIQMYEFEGILFASPTAMQDELTTRIKIPINDWANKILSDFQNNPEKINNSEQTVPSKRLLAATNYRKTTHGPNIAKTAGIAELRSKCAGFNHWLAQLEQLA